MRVYLSPDKPKTTIIEHTTIDKGMSTTQTIEFSNNSLAKTAFVMAVNDENPIFVHFNRYMDKLPKNRQDEIFDIIAEIQSEIENTNNLESTNGNLKILFAHLFKRIIYDEILSLVLNDKSFNSDITLPSLDNIKTKYEGVSDNYTKEKTYIFSEYQEFIALIIQLRIMFPIWAHYIEVFSSNLGTNYKEYEAFKLIEDSELFHNRAMLKLRRYVEAITPDEGSKAAIIDFISSDDYPLYNLALVVVRKICTMEIRNPGERQPILIMHTSTHIREKISNNDKKQGSIIADKKGQDIKSSSEEHQISMLERFKIKDKLTVGQKVFLLESVDNPLDLARKLKPNIDLDLVSAVLADTLRMGSQPVERVQKIILKNVISHVVSFHVVDLMPKSTLINSLGAVAAVLISDGFYGIAQFLTATTIPSDGGVTIATDQHQNKVTSELRERLIAQMPYQRSGRAKATTSPIVDNVDIIFKELTNKVWHNNLPDFIILQGGTGAVIRRIKIPGNLRIMLTEFAIYLAERTFSVQAVEDKLSNLKY